MDWDCSPQLLFARTADGIELALRRVPARGERRAVCLATHAMMANSRYLAPANGNGFASHLARRGIETFLLDFRGHGHSRPPLSRHTWRWCFDDYVQKDLPAAVRAVCDSAAIAPSELVYSGHSLGGLVGLAALGTGTVSPFRAMAAWATSVWLPGSRGARGRRWLMRVYELSSWPLGRAPVRRFGLGSDDEPRGYVSQLASWAVSGQWRSRAGADYLASLANVRVPVWAACGLADRLCHPRDAGVLLSRLTGKTVLRQVGTRHGDPLDANHFDLLTRPALAPLWDEMLAFAIDSRDIGENA